MYKEKESPRIKARVTPMFGHWGAEQRPTKKTKKEGLKNRKIKRDWNPGRQENKMCKG